MQLLVHAGADQKKAFLQRKLPPGVSVAWYNGTVQPADAYFDLEYEAAGHTVFDAVADAPVFVNAVIADRGQLGAHVTRINAWPGFFTADRLEIAAVATNEVKAMEVMDALGWQYLKAPDQPGMIAARVIAMIINEAWFAWGDGVSSREEIDTAMKLGTNYPYGPFEWGEKIGLAKVYHLLKALGNGQPGNRYEIAPALVNECRATNR